MIIEQVEALKIWLTNKLSPICDAEPGALAKYVCALVKKDKSEQELRDICIDQLDVFLQQNTRPFVDELFEVLKSKVYIPPASETKQRPPAVVPLVKHDSKSPSHHGGKEKDEGQKKKASEISSTTDDKENRDSSVAVTTASSVSASNTLPSSKDSTSDSLSRALKDPPREVREPRASSRDLGRDRERDEEGPRDRRDSWRDDRNREGIRDARDIIRENREKDRVDLKSDTREVREPRDLRDRDYRDRDRDKDYRRRRTRSRSFSPRRRDYDIDRRRRFEERPRYSPDRRWGRRRSWSRSPRRNRSPLDRGIVRPRSRSPRPRSRSPRERYRSFRSRTRSRTRSPRSPRPRSWSRPGSGARPRTRSLSNTHLPDSRGSTPLQDNDYISSSTNELPAVTSTVSFRPLGEERGETRLALPYESAPLPSFVSGVGRDHCKNFEEKGFCMLGDMCPYDHGSDPVVVEDMSIPSVIPGSASTSMSSSGGSFVTPDLRVPPPGHMAVRINLQRPPPTLVEPYMPEAPGLHQLPMLRAPPPDLRQPPPRMLMNRPPHPHPDPFFLPSREVILNRPPLHLDQGVDTLEASRQDIEPSRIVIPSKRPYSAIDNDPNVIKIGPPPPRIAAIAQHRPMFGTAPPLQPPLLSQNQPIHRRGFDYSRLGVHGKIPVPRPQFKPGNVTLEVRKIPNDLNNITKLNEHFSKFGTLTNIQVKFQGDPGAALISFSSNSEANAAYRSPEPVFNNRFIKLFWHNAEKQINLDGETESPVVVTVGEDGRDVRIQQTSVTGGRVGDGIDHPSLMLPVRPNIPPAHKLQVDNTKPKPASSSASLAGSDALSGSTEKSIVYTSSVGNLKKTVFNPAARVKVSSSFVSPTAMKTADHVSRMEAISRAEEERKLATIKQAELEHKRQELLAKQIQQQKILIDTLEKRKATMSEDEKKDLYKALKTISDAIDKVKYGTGAKRPQTTTFQPPVVDHFKFTSGHDQMMSYGRGRGWSGARAPAWAPRGRGQPAMSFLGRTHLDNRPKTIEVKGFDLSELEEIKLHFQRFGDIEKVEVVEEVPSAFLTYVTRPTAELAVSQGGRFKKKTLIVRWNQMTPKIVRTESTQSSELDDDLSVTLGSLNEDSTIEAGMDDKSDKMSSSVLTPDTPQELDKDTLVFETENMPEGTAARPPKPPYERSLSEDLLATGEENFKAVYTDDEDDEDHITVTLPNTTSVPPSMYSSDIGYSSSSLGQERIGDDLLEEDQGNFGSAGMDYEESTWA